MNILAFHNETGSQQWRLKSPANYINANTEHEMYVTSHKNWHEDTLGADIVVAQMWRNPKAIDLCHELGAKVVYEADDIVIGVGGKDRPDLMQLTPEQTQQTIDTIAQADLVTVTTEKLRQHYLQYNQNVAVLPNYMDFLWWGMPWRSKRVGSLRIGWAGSISHKPDLEFFAPIIKDITEKYPVKFISCGYGGKIGLYGEDLFSAIKSDKKEYYSGVPLEWWTEKSKSLCLDIGVAPLIEDTFNAGKSPIKYFEYSANFVPGVYSDTVVYHDTVKEELLAKTQQDWFDALSELIENDKLRLDMANRAYQHVFKDYNLADKYNLWTHQYQSLLPNQTPSPKPDPTQPLVTSES